MVGLVFAGGMRPFCIGMVHREILRANGRIYGELHGNSANQNEIASLVETFIKASAHSWLCFIFFSTQTKFSDIIPLPSSIEFWIYAKNAQWTTEKNPKHLKQATSKFAKRMNYGYSRLFEIIFYLHFVSAKH